MIQLLTTKELAQHFQVTNRTILDWVRDGTIPVIRPSPRVLRFDLAAVAEAVTIQHAKGETTCPTR